MKLYLSSVGIPDQKAYLKLFSKKQPRRVVIVTTAWNTAPSSKSQPFIDAVTTAFKHMDFTHQLLDLAACPPSTVAHRLEGAAAIWVTGGNSFYLNYWMREAGFDKLLPGLLEQGLVYSGESAGAVVAGKTLHGIEVLDNPAEAPEIIWPGLGLVDYGIIPHWSAEKYGERLEVAYEEMRLFCSVKTLRDQEYILTY